MIHIEIKQSCKLPGLQNAFITFEEYNEQLIDKIRQLKDRRYDADTKSWEITLYDLEYFIAVAKEYQINIKLHKQPTSITLIPSDFTFKTAPFAYQMDGIKYGINHNTMLLGDSPGLGKTLQSSYVASVRKHLGLVKQCLVICCVNSIKYNWEKEIKETTNEDAFVLGTRFRKNGNRYNAGLKERLEDLKIHKEFFLITNIETLRNESFVKQVLKMKSQIQMIICDETHLARNPQASQSKGLLKLDDFKYKMALTGTPIVNKPLDAYVALKWLNLEKANYSTFKSFYCSFGGFGNHQIDGYRNLDKLRDSLTHCMLRRLKEDVLKDLPDKTEMTDYVEMSDAQQKIYDEMKNEALENIDLIAASNNPLSMLLRLRQATGDTSLLSSSIHESAKLDRLEEIVEELSDNGRKCIIFSNWSQITDRVRNRLSRYHPAYITGDVPNIQRQEEIKRFQTDPKCEVFIGTIGAAGTGITLTAADTVIFVDLPWHRAAFDQCSDRAHRIGQKHNVTIIKLLCKNTIDERIAEIVWRKGMTADLLVDGKAPKVNKADLLKLIG